MQSKLQLFTGKGDAGTNPSHLALIRLGNAAAQLVLRTQAGRKEDATASLNLSVSPTRLRRYCCAVRRDARHTVRGQPRRKALRSYPTGQVRRKEKHPRPAPHLSRPYGLICRGAADELDLVAVRVIDVHGTAGENGMLAAARLVTGSH